jgi:hypothetical protein
MRGRTCGRGSWLSLGLSSLAAQICAVGPGWALWVTLRLVGPLESLRELRMMICLHCNGFGAFEIVAGQSFRDARA